LLRFRAPAACASPVPRVAASPPAPRPWLRRAGPLRHPVPAPRTVPV